MNTAENHYSLLDPWTTRPDHSAPWIGPSAFGDNAAVTRALQVTLSSFSSSPSSSSSSTIPSPSLSAFLLRRRRNPLTPGASRAASKPRRKSHAAAKRPPPTTYISANVANFREMVQWVTGLGSEQPAEEGPTVREAAMQQIGLSTLETSAPFLASAAAAGSPAASDLGPVFPTLESWGLM